jgi:hypothetical protein
MADQIIAHVQNVSASESYRVSVYDLFGGGTREVSGSPFNLNAGDPPSPPFAVYVDATGNGMIRCLDPNGQPLCSDAPLPNGNNNTVTFPERGPLVEAVTGRVYDIDYLANQNWVQIAMRAAAEPIFDPLFVRNNLGIQNALQAGMMSKRDVLVIFERQTREVQEVKILAAPDKTRGNVKEFRIRASGLCSVTIEGEPVAASANDPRCQLLICTAIATFQELEYVTIEGEQVVRAKINLGEILK